MKFITLKVIKNPIKLCDHCGERKATVTNDILDNLCRKCLKAYIEWGKEIEEDNKRFGIIIP